MTADPRTDEQLLAAAVVEPEAFAVFYRRHARPLAAYFVRRTRDPERAADLTAEAFAVALDGARRFDPGRGPAVAWLYGIARNLLFAAERRGRGEDRARRRLGMERLVLDDGALADVEALGADDLATVLDGLPAGQRDAVRARVLEERGYAEIAAAARTSESVIRKRVSRGLAGLRGRLGGNRL